MTRYPKTTPFKPDRYPLPIRAMIKLRAAADWAKQDPGYSLILARRAVKLLEEENSERRDDAA